MKQEALGFEAVGQAASRRVAVLADGENLSFECAEALMNRIKDLGTATILRAYCNRLNPNGWDKDHRFQVTYLETVSGKNSADIRLVIDAMDIAYSDLVDTFVLLSTDCDFAPLAHRLRSVGYWVMGAGREETSDRFKLACSEFHVLESSKVKPPEVAVPTILPLSPIDAAIHRVCRKHGNGMVLLTLLGVMMPREEKIERKQTGKTNWRTYLATRPDLYALAGAGNTGTVRLHHT